MLVKERK